MKMEDLIIKVLVKYLKMQGYRRRRVKFKKIKQEDLDFVLQDIEKNAGQKLYQDLSQRQA